jgi:hypothetical protein
MKFAGKVLCTAFITYFVVWTALYFAIMRMDFSLYGHYLRLAWTRPGELPAVMQFFALMFSVASALVRIWIRRKKFNTKKEA